MGTVAHEMGMRLQTNFNKKISLVFYLINVGSNTLRETVKANLAIVDHVLPSTGPCIKYK